jgi:pimeloyl-ACP methyl ester carboxylesterase
VVSRLEIWVLAYDKAGCGDTPGNWRDQTLEDRVAETRGALDALRAEEAVDSNKVGLWAISQGGWVAPMVAAEDRRVAFMILVSAPGVSPFDQELASLEQRMRQTGEPEELVERASAAYWELVKRLRGGESPDEVAGWFQSVRNEALYAHFLPGLFSDPAVVSFFARIGDHDPIPSMRKVRCPVLLIYGEHDTLVPVGPSREIIVRQLNAADNHNVTVETFKGADHNLLVGPPSTGPGGSHPFAPGYGQLMTTWATAQIS